MPHFGLMNTTDSFEREEGALLRSRLHIRAGKRRLRQGKISAGIVTLYDALLFALKWYVASPLRREGLTIMEEDDLSDDRNIIAILKRSNVCASDFDYPAFDALAEKASNEEMSDYDYAEMLRGFEAFVTCLGVMPFNEADLPKEDPATF